MEKQEDDMLKQPLQDTNDYDKMDIKALSSSELRLKIIKR